MQVLSVFEVVVPVPRLYFTLEVLLAVDIVVFIVVALIRVGVIVYFDLRSRLKW